MVKRESCPSKIGPINLGTKQTGAPSAGNPHAGCDVAGAGNGFTVWILRHSQRKRGATDRPDLRNTAPVLDPTGIATGISWPALGCGPLSQRRFWGVIRGWRGSEIPGLKVETWGRSEEHTSEL